MALIVLFSERNLLTISGCKHEESIHSQSITFQFLFFSSFQVVNECIEHYLCLYAHTQIFQVFIIPG